MKSRGRGASFSVTGVGEGGVVRSTSSMIGGKGVGDGALATFLMIDSSVDSAVRFPADARDRLGVAGGNAIGPAKCGSDSGSTSARCSNFGRSMRSALVFETERPAARSQFGLVRQRLTIVSQSRSGIQYRRFLP